MWHVAKQPNSLLEYMYRDASNWKFHGEVVVAGHLAISDLEPFLADGEFFVPEDVGLAALRPSVTNEDDHIYHSIESIEPSDRPVSGISATNLIAAFRHNRETNDDWKPLCEYGLGPKLPPAELEARIAFLTF